MTREDWDTLENIKNDYTELRCGNRTTRDDKQINQKYLQDRMVTHAKYAGHLNWKVLRGF